MIKTYVLDTNVLLHDPASFKAFEDNTVVIPICVFSEIDKFKKELTERGRNARIIARELDALRKTGNFSDGITLPSGGKLFVAFREGANPLTDHIPPDEQILLIAQQIKEKNNTKPCIVISKDITMRLKADSIGLNAEDYENGQTKIASETYSGHTEIIVKSNELEEFEDNKRLKPSDVKLFPNQYVTLISENSQKKSALARYDAELNLFVPLIQIPQNFGPIRPRNRGQRFAMDALLNDEIQLVTITGKAGTGKTLLALAVGLYKTKKKTYNKVLVSRPVFPMGKDLGFLPGDINEKFSPWIQPIYDALDVIECAEPKSGSKDPKTKQAAKSESARTNGTIEVEPLTYIRGRSLPKQFIIIDESQNLTPLEVKTVLTRVGTGTKIVLTGDIYQIDNPYIDALSNGLNAVADKFRNETMAAHIFLDKGERSKLAELASNLL